LKNHRWHGYESVCRRFALNELIHHTPPMTSIRIAYLGDIYGAPGRMAVQQQLPILRERHQPHLIFANAENARSGSGLSPKIFHKLRALGIHGMTLGDHVFRDQTICSVLETPDEPLARPANLSAKALGRSYLRVALPAELGISRDVFVIPVLGRVFMNMPADDPFAAVDRVLASLPVRDPLVIVEAHMEATSEKSALARYLDGRVAAVLGTHTHVPTADARVLPQGTGFITDLGMCGPYESIIGADVDAVVRHMTTSMHVPFGVGMGGEAVCGVVLEIDTNTRRTKSILPLRLEADRNSAPFVA
jgi:metallophosphoesterase (TIGR00282 family)